MTLFSEKKQINYIFFYKWIVFTEKIYLSIILQPEGNLTTINSFFEGGGLKWREITLSINRFSVYYHQKAIWLSLIACLKEDIPK